MAKSTLKTTSIKAGSNPPSLQRTETFTELSTTKMISVICTPYRTLEILESPDGMFCLRETSWANNHAGVSTIWLKPYEMAALRESLAKVQV